MPANKSIRTPLSLYPAQRAIVEAFAKKTNRSFSNAVQFIIEDWARLADPDGTLLRQSEQTLISKSRAARKPVKKQFNPDIIPSVTRGMLIT